jgi:hypothetical protein
VAAVGLKQKWNLSPQTNFLAAFGFGVAGTLYFAIAGRDLASLARQPKLT